MFLKKLDPRGQNIKDLVKKTSKGYIFYCYEVETSVVVSGFYATGEKSNLKQLDENTTTWQVFVPFKKTTTLEWNGQHLVTVLVTVHGVLEIAHEWIGGGECCYFAEGVFPSGKEIFSANTADIFWSLKRSDNTFYKKFNSQAIAKAWEGYIETRLVYIGSPRLEVRELKD